MSSTDPSALEPVVGVYGLRTFRVSLDGKLLPIGHLSDDWDGGRCIARCAIGGDHTAPETDCTCGIYSFRDRVHLSKQFSAAHSLIAVVALEGTTIEGDRGWRSQAAQVVALWIAHDALPSSLRAALLAGLPSVREYTSPMEMIANFPGLTCSEDYPPAESLPRREWPRRASTSIRSGLRRWSLARVSANFLLSVGIKTSVLTLLLQTWPPVDAPGDRGILQSWLTANHDLLVYLALNPGVLIAFFVTTTIFGAVFAIGQVRKRSWLCRVTWAAGTLALAMPLAATFADLNPPWVTWSGFLAVNVLLYLATQPVPPSWSSIVPTGQVAAGGPRPLRWTSEHGLRVHEIIEPVTFPGPERF